MIDAVDREILRLLQENARLANAELARRLEMAPSAVLERVRKLEARGILVGYAAEIAPAALGFGLLAFVFVRAEEPVASGQVGQALAAVPGVLEVHHIAGEDCYLLKVRCADTQSLGLFLREHIGSIPEVRSTRTTIVLRTVKEDMRLPLPEATTASKEEEQEDADD